MLHTYIPYVCSMHCFFSFSSFPFSSPFSSCLPRWAGHVSAVGGGGPVPFLSFFSFFPLSLHLFGFDVSSLIWDDGSTTFFFLGVCTHNVPVRCAVVSEMVCSGRQFIIVVIIIGIHHHLVFLFDKHPRDTCPFFFLNVITSVVPSEA